MNSEIQIATMVPADLAGSEVILRQHVQWPPFSGNVIEEEVQADLRKMQRSFENPDRLSFIVARNLQDEVLGFMGFGLPTFRMVRFTSSDPAHTIELFLAHVRNEDRGKGVGRALFEAMEQEILRRGRKRVILNSGPRYSESGWGFYQKVGCQEVGDIENYYGRGYPAKVWKKDLLGN